MKRFILNIGIDSESCCSLASTRKSRRDAVNDRYIKGRSHKSCQVKNYIFGSLEEDHPDPTSEECKSCSPLQHSASLRKKTERNNCKIQCRVTLKWHIIYMRYLQPFKNLIAYKVQVLGISQV